MQGRISVACWSLYELKYLGFFKTFYVHHNNVNTMITPRVDIAFFGKESLFDPDLASLSATQVCQYVPLSTIGVHCCTVGWDGSLGFFRISALHRPGSIGTLLIISRKVIFRLEMSVWLLQELVFEHGSKIFS